MRLLAATLALCGCNQIYGLEPTGSRDAAPDAQYRQVRLSMLVGQTTDAANEAPAFLAAVAPDPKPRIALASEPLESAAYVADSTSGTIDYPPSFVGQPWRLEYTPPNDVPSEVQWSPADGSGHLIVPFVGRMERTTVPAGTGFTLSMKLPNQVLYSFTPETVIYTSGYWSATPSTVQTLTPAIDFSVAASMSGPRGAPSASAKDYVFAIDYRIDSGCRVTKAAGTARVPELEAGTMKPVELVVESNSEMVEATYESELPMHAQTRLQQALGTRSDDQTGSTLYYGRIAHAGLPGFTTSIAGVPAPLIVPLAECPAVTLQPPAVFDLGGGLAFTKAMYVFVSNDRIVNGAKLRSSIAAIGRLKTGNGTYQATLSVPCATQVKLGGQDLEVTDAVSIGSTPLDLTFAVDTTSFVVDYFEVVLYRIANATLEPIRTYVGPDPAKPSIRFDPKVMMPNDDYVFAIRTYRGRPNARNADFQTVQGAQAVATIFTRTFKR